MLPPVLRRDNGGRSVGEAAARADAIAMITPCCRLISHMMILMSPRLIRCYVAEPRVISWRRAPEEARVQDITRAEAARRERDRARCWLPRREVSVTR